MVTQRLAGQFFGVLANRRLKLPSPLAGAFAFGYGGPRMRESSLDPRFRGGDRRGAGVTKKLLHPTLWRAKKVPRSCPGRYNVNVPTTGAWSLVPTSRNDGHDTAWRAIDSQASR